MSVTVAEGDRFELGGSLALIRPAQERDRTALERLIARSARGLCSADYTVDQIESALAGAFGVDSRLIADRTYYLVEVEGTPVACGGWSFRRTLFGGDAGRERDNGRLDPERDAAKIRAFFVDPRWARQGLGRRLLERCEAAAVADGFRRFELMATRAGERLYRRYGYDSAAPIDYDLGDELTIEFVPMVKRLQSADGSSVSP